MRFCADLSVSRATTAATDAACCGGDGCQCLLVLISLAQMAEARLNTAVTSLFGIKHPILLAGMNVAAGPELAAAVTNAGGLGVIGGVGYTPKFLKLQIANLKAALVDKEAPFGIDLLLPKVGEGARKVRREEKRECLVLTSRACADEQGLHRGQAAGAD